MSRGCARPEGVRERHLRRCESHRGGACSCEPRYQAQVWSARDRKPIRRTFATSAEAVAWRQETQVALRKGTVRAPSATTLADAAEQWLAAADAGVIRTRSGDRYKPSALRTYRYALTSKVLPALGQRRLTAVPRNDLQDFVDNLVAKGQSASTVRNAILPLRAIYARARERDEIAINPTRKLRLPAVRGTRERTARAEEARALLEVLPDSDRTLWATALYAGLRRGELQALEWQDVDLENNLIHVRRAWDQREGVISPKSRARERRVPIPMILRQHLLRHRLRQGSGGRGYVFANRNGRPFDPNTIANRARKAWQLKELEPIGLHECRHTYAAFMIGAGINAKALSTYMGHTSITVTLDRYGHLLPGNERQAADALDRWLSAQGVGRDEAPGS
jgi:integrase